MFKMTPFGDSTIGVIRLFSIEGEQGPKLRVDYSSDYPDAVQKQILDLLDLQPGWNFGSGVAFSRPTVQYALHIYRLSKSYPFEVAVFPEDDARVTLSFAKDEHFLDVTIAHDKCISVKYELGLGENFEETEIGTVSEQNLEGLFTWFLKKETKNNLSGSSTSGFTTQIKNVFKILPLRVPAMEAESPYFLKVVPT